jgi:DNA-binding GntR family transcriptional regulator
MAESIKKPSIKRLTLAEQVYIDLKNSIITHQIPPGSRINEVELAEQFEVSPTPIREALSKLRGDGLVQYRGWQGACVVELKLNDIYHLFDIRCELECLALKEAAPSVEISELKLLKSFLMKYKDRNDFKGRNEANEKFHNFFIEKSGNLWLKRMLDEIKDILLMIRYPLSEVRPGADSHNQHLQIIECLERKDIDSARVMMAKHIDSVKNELIALCKENTYLTK